MTMTKPKTKTIKKKSAEKPEVKNEVQTKYLEAVGRRKESIARIRLYPVRGREGSQRDSASNGVYPEKGGDAKRPVSPAELGGTLSVPSGPAERGGEESDTREKGNLLINQKPYSDYFKDPFLRNVVEGPLRKLKSLDRFRGTVKVSGGGMTGQAQAIQLGIARALILFDENYSKKLRKFGFLTQDSRIKERRKYGLKKARKAPQWAKR